MPNKTLRRSAYITHLTGAINKLDQALQQEPIEEILIDSLIEQVTQKFSKVEVCSNELQNEMDDTALEADIEKIDDLENQVIDVKVKARAVIDKLHKENSGQKTPDNATPVYLQHPPQIAAKLPDAKLKEFHGVEEEFPSFIDNFTALVHNNPYLPDVEKFSYLRGIVKVDVINHFPLTAEFYQVALDKLKKVYGDTTLIVTKHLNSLLDMNKRKKPTNNKELEEFYHFLETKITCLETLNRPITQDNEMLITLIYRQVPRKLKQKIANLSQSHTTVMAVLDIIKKYLRTSKHMSYREESSDESDADDGEVYDYKDSNKLKSHTQMHKPKYKRDNYEHDSDESYTPVSGAAALPVVSQRSKSCIYCQGNHSPIYCQNVTDITQRREIVRRSNRCYNCLIVGHRQTECRNSGRCRGCHGKHHTSLCNQRQQPTHTHQQGGAVGGQNAERGNTQINQGLTTAIAWEGKGPVLLQMATAELRKPHGVKSISVNIFLDLGSQLSYCTNKIKKDLNLDVKANDVLDVNTFGTNDSNVLPADVVTLQIDKDGFTKEINVHTTDVICADLPSFNISKRRLQEIGQIKLAHPPSKYNGSHKISLLIGADLYWEFVGVEMITTSYGLRASSSKLGWLLSGRTTGNPNTRQVLISLLFTILVVRNYNI